MGILSKERSLRLVYSSYGLCVFFCSSFSYLLEKRWLMHWRQLHQCGLLEMREWEHFRYCLMHIDIQSDMEVLSSQEEMLSSLLFVYRDWRKIATLQLLQQHQKLSMSWRNSGKSRKVITGDSWSIKRSWKKQTEMETKKMRMVQSEETQQPHCRFYVYIDIYIFASSNWS